MKPVGSSVTRAAVRIETATGALEGTLIDNVPDGYLVRLDGEQTQVVPFTSGQKIETISPPPKHPGK